VDLDVVEICYIEKFTYYLQLLIGFEVILKDPIAKWNVATSIMFRLNISKLCGKEIEVGYVAIVMQEVFKSNTMVPYGGVTINKCCIDTKILKGVVILWSSKFMKLVRDALAHNANVALLTFLGVFGGINVHHIHFNCVIQFCMATCKKKSPCFGQVHMVLHDCFSLKMF